MANRQDSLLFNQVQAVAGRVNRRVCVGLTGALLAALMGAGGSAWAAAAGVATPLTTQQTGDEPSAFDTNTVEIEASSQTAQTTTKFSSPVIAKGLASWYGGKFHGRRTASGEIYDKNALTAAHKTLPFGTLLRVKSVRTGKEVVVRINDRGPYAQRRMLDLSRAAFMALGLKHRGVTMVVMTPQ